MTLLKRLCSLYSAWRFGEEEGASASSSQDRPAPQGVGPMGEIRRLENARTREGEKMRDFQKLGLAEMAGRSKESFVALGRRLEALRLSSRRAG